MQLATIEDTDRAEARRKYLEYRAAAQDRGDVELETIAAGYRAISRGQQVISLRDTLIAAGTTDVTTTARYWNIDGNKKWTEKTAIAVAPRLAITGAHHEWCWLDFYSPAFYGHEHDRLNRRHGIRIPAELGCRTGYGVLRAMVPLVPPSLRPGALYRYHILWEAEWEAIPPKDPALLKHIRGDLYAVLATWDLTNLERAVIAERFNRQ